MSMPMVEIEMVWRMRGPREFMVDAIAFELCFHDGLRPMEHINVGYECGDVEMVPRMKSAEYQETAQRILARLGQFQWPSPEPNKETMTAPTAPADATGA